MDIFDLSSTGIFLGICMNLIFCILLPIIVVGGTIFWIMMLIDAANRKYENENDKTLWIIIVVLGQLIGAIIYYFVIKNKDKLKK